MGEAATGVLAALSGRRRRDGWGGEGGGDGHSDQRACRGNGVGGNRRHSIGENDVRRPWPSHYQTRRLNSRACAIGVIKIEAPWRQIVNLPR